MEPRQQHGDEFGCLVDARVVDRVEAGDEPWYYADYAVFVFTHRELDPIHPGVRFVAGTPAELRATIEEAAGEKGVWVVGGGDLAGRARRICRAGDELFQHVPGRGALGLIGLDDGGQVEALRRIDAVKTGHG